MAHERLQKVLAAAGIGSRRASEALIAAGRVTVDGRVAKLGESADPDVEAILVDGRAIGAAAIPVHLALNKPGGVTSTVRDPHADRTVIDLVPRAMIPPNGRLYPVGRLDLDSEGLILLTNDGPWADRIVHPRHGVDREYVAAVAWSMTQEQIERLEAGIELEEGLAIVLRFRRLPAPEVGLLAGVLDPAPDQDLAWYTVVIRQGWKRQLRRMFGAVGAPIVRLVRVRIGQVRLERLRPGRVRQLTVGEVRTLAGEPAPKRRKPKTGSLAAKRPAAPSGPRSPRGRGRVRGSGPGSSRPPG